MIPRVEAALAGDHQIGGGNALLEFQEFGDDAESGDDPGAAKGHQSEAEAAGGAGARSFGDFGRKE